MDSKSDTYEFEEPTETTITPPHRPEPLRREGIIEEAAFSYGEESHLPLGETPYTLESGEIPHGESESAADRAARGGESGAQTSAFILGEQE